jgi:CDP-6-deoxy-D-xylo-4-hexulose-3-dehydrase
MVDSTGIPLAASSWSGDEYAAIDRVIRSSQFSMASEVRAFEKEFSRAQTRGHGCMVNSGSSANLVMLAAARFAPDPAVSPGSEVIVPAVSWSTTYYPVNQAGARLRFVDVDPAEFNMSVDQVEQAIGPTTSAVLAVNLLGNPAHLVELRDLCDSAGIVLLEDNCESLGATLEGKPTGSFGLAATYSFFFSHHMTTMEGGMVVTDDEAFLQTCQSLRAHGWTRGLPADNHLLPLSGDPWEDLFRFVLPGYNVRPLEIEAAIGQEQLKKLPAMVDERRRNGAYFQKLFSGVDGVRIQEEHGQSSWFGFGLVLTDHLAGRRREVVEALERAGIETRPIVAGNFTRNPVMQHLDAIVPERLPVADEIHDQGLFFGNHHFDVSEGIARAAEVISSL